MTILEFTLNNRRRLLVAAAYGLTSSLIAPATFAGHCSLAESGYQTADYRFDRAMPYTSARIVGTLLDDVAGFDRQASHAVILQALSIATAVRLAMAETAARQNVDRSMKLLDIEVESEREVATYPAQ